MAEKVTTCSYQRILLKLSLQWSQYLSGLAFIMQIFIYCMEIQLQF